MYDVNQNRLTMAYDATSNTLDYAYDIDSNVVFIKDEWLGEITIEKHYNSAANTYYYTIIIPQTRPNGEKQYPFVYAPNGSGGATMSTLQMMLNSNFYFGMNASYFDNSQQGTLRPYGITIENGVLIREDSSRFNGNYTLVIDNGGVLKRADPMQMGVTGQDVLSMGAVSAALGFTTLVENGQAWGVDSSQAVISTERAQRQIIGQFSNGDYCIITCEGRGYDNSDGFTILEAIQLCLDLGLTYAHAMDGGGSTETVVGKTQINTIYEGATGRKVPTYIVFNGTDHFFVPGH